MGQEQSALNAVAPRRDQRERRLVSGTETMSFAFSRKFSSDLTLRPVESSGDGDVRVYVLLPTLQELLGRSDFGRRNAILLPGHRRPLDGWALFGTPRERGLVLH
jgi:hypothetical protein